MSMHTHNLHYTDAINSSDVCTGCLIYIITGSVVGSATLLVVCSLLVIVMICIALRSKRNNISDNEYDRPDVPVYECIHPAYEIINPIVSDAMTENEAYNTCCRETGMY